MNPCRSCAAPLAAGARFCVGCGASVAPDGATPPSPGATPPPPGAPPPSPGATPPSPAEAGTGVTEPSICPGCGLLVDASRGACATCSAPYPAPPLRALPQPNGGYWVAVRATFTCNACRFDVPLNHFEIDEGVVCTRCGLEQRYDPSNWRELASFAHAVGDLGAPGPEGRLPDPEVRLSEPKPFDELGVSETWAASGKFRASPGNPLCRTCKAPRVVAARRDRVLDVTCSACREEHSYEVPARTRLKGLAGVLADEHEQGRREASLVDDDGVSVLRCPNCSAPLTDVHDDDGVVTCAYCHVGCRISSHTHARAGHKGTPVKTWWLYFEGPSSRRRKLLNEAKQDAARAAKRRARDAQRARAPAPRRDGPAERGDAPKRPRKNAERAAVAGLTAVVVGAAAVGLIIGLKDGAKSKAKAEAAAAASAALPSDDLLLRYSFAMTEAEASALFGVPAKPGGIVKFKDTGVFKEAHLGGVGGPTYSIALDGGAALDLAAAVRRLSTIAPNRLQAEANGMYELSTGKALLRLNPRGGPKLGGRVHVMTWLEGAAGIAAANAMLAAARYATMNGPGLTAAELALVNGPSLADVARFDVTTPIEEASARFVATFPAGVCGTTTDLMTKRTELLCAGDLDDPIFGKVRCAWPSAEHTHLRSVVLVRRSTPNLDGRPPPDPTDCLTKALGAGERKVVDYASGRAVLTWPLGKRGDVAVLEDGALRLASPDDAKPSKTPGWAEAYPKVLEALARCGR